MQYNEKDLFERLVELEKEKLTTTEDIKQLKKDFSFHKDHNPGGLAKDEVRKIAGAAKIEAKRDYEEKRQKTLEIFAKYEELTGYDD